MAFWRKKNKLAEDSASNFGNNPLGSDASANSAEDIKIFRAGAVIKDSTPQVTPNSEAVPPNGESKVNVEPSPSASSEKKAVVSPIINDTDLITSLKSKKKQWVAIEDGVVIKGAIFPDYPIVINGSLEGKVESASSVEVGKAGALNGDVEGAEELVISGSFVGNAVVPGKVTCTKDSEISGRISAGKIRFEPGAKINAEVCVRIAS